MEKIILGGLEISIKLDNMTAENLRKAIPYVFSNLININSIDHKDKDELTDNKNISNNN